MGRGPSGSERGRTSVVPPIRPFKIRPIPENPYTGNPVLAIFFLPKTLRPFEIINRAECNVRPKIKRPNDTKE